MPGEGFALAKSFEEHIWAQRCKLYIYRRKVQSWVELGTGKGSICQTKQGQAEFVFEDEKFKLPMVRHSLESASRLKANAGTDRGWSWTAKDQIQSPGDGDEKGIWFTVKFVTADAANQFEEVFRRLRPLNADDDNEDEVSDRYTTASPAPDYRTQRPHPRREHRERSSSVRTATSVNSTSARSISAARGREALEPHVPGRPQRPRSRQESVAFTAISMAAGTEASHYGGPSRPQRPRSRGTSLALTAAGASEWGEIGGQPKHSHGHGHESPGSAWILYFDKGTMKRGSALRETTTIYVGVYDDREAAMQNAVCVMDKYCDPAKPWREKELWEKREDNRHRCGDKGTVIGVQSADGVYFQVKVRRLPLNEELPRQGPEEQVLWP